jgi:hypothetical protein
MFNTSSGNQAVITAQAKVGDVTSSITAINTIITAISGPAASLIANPNTINSAVSAFSLKLTTLQNNVSALNSALGSNVSTTAQINTQLSTITSGITTLITDGTALYQAIDSNAAAKSTMGQYSNLPGLLSALKSDWDNSTPSLTNAASSLSTGSQLGFGDVITILTGVFGFNETQFNNYFKSIAANNAQNGTIAATVVRWVGVLMFGLGIVILSNTLKFNFFGIQVGDLGAG